MIIKKSNKNRVSGGISRIGGKFRSFNKIIEITPKHNFFLSLFCGACWYELNKPRAKYDCFNDIDSELINYLLIIRQYPKEFDDLKKGVFDLISQEIVNRIQNEKLKPSDNIERAMQKHPGLPP